ncbi:MAG TPA: MFS transporter [Bryobacteraceae bacterium]|nr:MFS transporter [Bryobacteraceae bacterium]
MRWTILCLLVGVTTINYLDRLLLSVLAPVLRDTFHFTDSVYGNISGAFQIAYALGYLFLARVVDRYGTKIGLGAAAALWSVASLLHATVNGVAQFGVWRTVLGLSEGANFPACNKAVAEWFPLEERALATGIFNAGVNLASVIGPPMFVALTAWYGWRACFAGVSSLGFIWLALWSFIPKAPRQARLGQSGLTLRQALRYRQAWGFIVGKILVDPAWFFMLFWLPLYFRDARKLQMSQIGWALPWIYFMAGLGSVAVGWLSGASLRRGATKRRARLGATLLCALIIPPAILAGLVTSVAGTVMCFSIAAAAHQAFSSMAFTMPGDVFPQEAVATVQGWGGFAGAISSVLFAAVLPGYLIPVFGYTPMLVVLSCGYLVAVSVHSVTFRDFQPALIQA